MTRAALEHILRACGAIADVQRVVVVGSQAVLGTLPSPPEALTVSIEADVYPLDHPDRADLIDGSIGEKSPFHETFGYYARGVGPETAILPPGWESRLVALANENTGGVTGLCLSLPDIAVSKLAAGRDKDRKYVQTLMAAGLVGSDTLHRLAEGLPESHRAIALQRLAGWQQGGGEP